MKTIPPENRDRTATARSIIVIGLAWFASRFHRHLLATCIVSLAWVPADLPAQISAPVRVNPEVPERVTSQSVALVLRRDLVTALLAGEIPPLAGIARLRGHASPSGLKLANAEADFAFAAIDVGHRLIPAGRPDLAESFFLEAEKALEVVLRRSSRSTKDEQVQYLSARALIRAQFLNKPEQAKADLDAAKQLRPDDKTLKGLEISLSSRNAASFGANPEKVFP